MSSTSAWLPLYRLSVGLGLRYLVRHRPMREAVVRVVVPMDPARYVELPWALAALSPVAGERALDLASPKLLAVALARRGVDVVSVDAFQAEIERWRRLTTGEPNLELLVADGRSLPFSSAVFDMATSISVLEHIEGPDGDVEALRELVRCVRPGGRIAITLPHAERGFDEYRETPHYGEASETSEGYFFQRWYDQDRTAALLEHVEGVQVASMDVAGLRPDLDRAYVRTFPWLVPLGLLYGLMAREVVGPPGSVQRILLVRT